MDCARSTKRACAGTTLTELMVVLVVLGVMATLVGFAWQTTAPSATSAGPAAVIAAARRRALESGVATRVAVPVGNDTVEVLALPDGRLVGADTLSMDPLTGRSAQR